MFDIGETVVCIESGANAANPWHRANPLIVGAEYPVLELIPSIHANGTRLEDMIRVDRSGRLWRVGMFRCKGNTLDLLDEEEELMELCS